MSVAMKRLALALLLVIAGGTATSGADYTSTTHNPQSFAAAADFGVHATLDDPSSPRRGTVPLSATATETQGGTIVSVAIQRSPAGAGSWTTICTDTIGPAYTCDWDTTGVANGQYDLRARATNQNGYSRASAVVAGRLVDNASPAVTIEAPAAWIRGTIALRSTASDTGGSGVAGVRYEYKPSAGSTWSTACTGSTAPDYSCSFNTTTLTNGTSYDFRAVATDGAGNFTNSAAATNRRPDNAAPSGSLSDPGPYFGGIRSLAFTASDAASGVASVAVQYAPAASGSWSAACTATASPFTSCNWDTNVAGDGLYDLRAIVTDVAGNTYTTATVVNRRVDNVLPLTSLDDPGSPLSGTVALNANATDTGGSGVRDVRIQRSAAGAGTWTDICTDTTFSYSCSWNTTSLPDALYDLRAVATDNADNAATSATVASRRVDNYVPSAVDVQTANGGATPGVIEVGDTITLTYSEQIDPSSIIAGWDGTGSQNIYIGTTHHNKGDRMMFHSPVGPNYPALPLATSPGVDLGENYVPNSGGNFAATLTQSGASFTVAVGILVGGGVNTVAPPAAAMRWYPSSAATDFVGKPASTTFRDETGVADREF